ncbi:MAG: flagellar basal body-associated FliL family protein [Firmicutes bacterium]|nr:flagellar basal body-associated FliL family protein [Bacillota bacterium]
MANETEKKGNEEKSKGKGRLRSSLKVLIVLIILLLIIFLLGSAVFIAVRTGFAGRLLSNMAGDVADQETAKEPSYTYEIPEIVVNLSNGNSRRFLSVKFYVGFDETKLTEELERRMPEIRDAVLQLLWDTRAEDIDSPEEKEKLREKIKEVINGLVKSGEIKGVYFWHVMVQ